MKGILNSDIIPEELLGLEGTPPPEEAMDVNIEKIDNDEIDNEEQVIRSLSMQQTLRELQAVPPLVVNEQADEENVVDIPVNKESNDSKEG